MKKIISILCFILILISCGYHNTGKAKKIWLAATKASFERKHAKALLLLQEATKADPEFTPAWMSKGRVYAALKQDQKAMECYEEALKIYEKQLEREPDNIDLIKEHAEVLLLLGDKKGSVRILNRAIKQFPEDETLPLFKKMILKSSEREINHN
ncbi:MAG: tetratricopeptide repeat protein [Desulfobacterales bacterium]